MSDCESEEYFSGADHSDSGSEQSLGELFRLLAPVAPIMQLVWC